MLMLSMKLALSGTLAARFGTTLQQRVEDSGLTGSHSRSDAARSRADIGAAQVQTDAAAQGDNPILRQTSIGTTVAVGCAGKTLVYASGCLQKQSLRRPGMGLQHRLDVHGGFS
jgi:hypothetical protein